MSFYQGANELSRMCWISSVPFVSKKTSEKSPNLANNWNHINGALNRKIRLYAYQSQSRFKMIDIVPKLNYANSIFQSPLRQIQKHTSELNFHCVNTIECERRVCVVCLSVSIFLWHYHSARIFESDLNSDVCHFDHLISNAIDTVKSTWVPSVPSKYLLFFHSSNHIRISEFFPLSHRHIGFVYIT